MSGFVQVSGHVERSSRSNASVHHSGEGGAPVHNKMLLHRGETTKIRKRRSRKCHKRKEAFGVTPEKAKVSSESSNNGNEQDKNKYVKDKGGPQDKNKS